MDESEIAARLQQTIAPPPEPNVVPETPVRDAPTDDRTAIAPMYPLDELVQYKLHDYFGEPYKANDEIKRQQAEYIYTKVADMVEDKDYGFVIAKIRDLERIIGITNDDRRMYKLYQWLKLDNVRRSIDAQMGALTHG